MAEERKRKKRRIRIDYRKAVRSLTLLVLVLMFIINLLSALIGTGERFDRDLIREYGNPDAKKPDITAKAAAIYSLDLNDYVYLKKPDRKLAPYSMTKILTCYLALENLDPDQIVTVSENATKELVDGMEMELSPGEQLKAIDLIYASMLMSANDAATALGEAVAGSESAFADLMNETVAGWGCENSHFVNANGWKDDDHYTTARDMAIITKKCLENDTLRKIATTKEYTVPATNMSGPLELENAFLNATKGLDCVTGGKTGSWSATQCTLTFEFTEDALSAVVVLLDDTAEGRAEDPAKLVKFSHKVTPGFMVTDGDKEVCKAWVKGGAKSKVTLGVKGRRFAYPESQKASGVRVEMDIDDLKAPISKGDRCGKYYIHANDRIVGQGYLYAQEDVEKGWLLSNLYVSNSAGFISILVLMLLALLEVLTRSRGGRKSSEQRIAEKRQNNRSRRGR